MLTKLEALTSFLRSFNKESALKTLCGLGYTLYNQNEKYITVKGVNVAAYVVKCLAEILLVRCTTEGFKLFTVTDLARAAAMLSEVESEMASHFRQTRQKRAREMMIYNLARLQFPSQHGSAYALPRMRWIYDRMIRDNEGLRGSIDSLFEKSYGVAYQDFFACAWVLLGVLLSKTPYKMSREFLSKAIPPAIAAPFTRFVESLSVTVEELRLLDRSTASQHDWEFIYNSSLLIDSPIIEIEEGQFVSPDVFSTIACLALALQRRLIASAKDSDDVEKVGSGFGYAFQDYVGWQLAQFSFPGRTVYPEFDMEASQKSIDWIVVEDSCCTLIECKSKRDKLTGIIDGDDIAAFLAVRKGHIDSIQRCRKTEQYIRRTNLVGCKRILPSEYRYVVVSNECPYLRNEVYLGFLEDAGLSSETLKKVHFLTIDEVETLSPFLKSHYLSEVLRAQEASDATRGFDVRNLLRELSLNECEELRNDYLEDIIDEMVHGMEGRVWPHGEQI